MAKKRSVDDLEDELAQIEAELAALEGRAPPPKAKKAPAKPAPAPEAARAEPAAAEQDEAPAEKRKLPFGLGRKKERDEESASEPAERKQPKFALPFGKKKQQHEAQPEAPAADEPETPALLELHAEVPPAIAQAPGLAIVEDGTREREIIPVTDASLWRSEDGGAWVRQVEGTPKPVVRRILNDDGEVVREETATQDELDEATGARAQRGVTKLLGGAGKSLKLPSFGRFGRKNE